MLRKLFLITNNPCIDMNPQEAVPGGDADYGSMFETELSPTSKGDNSTDLSWSSTPVSFHLSAITNITNNK